MSVSFSESDVFNLKVSPIPVVRVAFIGLGIRAKRALNRLIHIEGVFIVALCDVNQNKVDEFQSCLLLNNKPRCKEFVGKDAWRNLCQESDVDLLYVCTDWFTHAEIAIEGMKYDKHVAVEVPIALTVEDCWRIVEVAEKAKKHCFMLENSCYDAFEMATLNMLQQGCFGEVMHFDTAYIHDLRERLLTNEFGARSTDNWQNKYNSSHTGNPYPTHALGPVCLAMNINRGDRLGYLVSMSTHEKGFSDFIARNPELKEYSLKYSLGDMNTTLIATEKNKTIMLQHDISNPRPYSRIHAGTCTHGFFQKYPSPYVFLESEEDKTETYLDKYMHPFYKKYGQKAVELCAERARDYIMDSRLIYCLQNGLSLDMNVYDAVTWSSIIELSEKSVLNKSESIDIPDFTRGKWNKYLSPPFQD